MFTTRLLAAAAFAAVTCVPAYADDAPSPPADETVLPPKYNQIPQDYEEFAAVYKKALTFLRATGAQSIHKCFPAGADPSDPNHGFCTDYMFWGNPQGKHIFTADGAQDDGKHMVQVCLGDDMALGTSGASRSMISKSKTRRAYRLMSTLRQARPSPP
jgi:hypothetical protein